MSISKLPKGNSLQRITGNCEMVIDDSNGGTKTIVGGDVVHTFTSSGTNSLSLSLIANYSNSRVISPSTEVSLHALLIGGGGGAFTGGGGGGGFVYSSRVTASNSNTIVVGGGGASGSGSAAGGTASNGGDTTAFNLIAYGGGGAGGSGSLGAPGASGGGNGMDTAGNARRTGIAGQGYSGGNSNANSYGGGGGGGGAGQQGGDAYGPNGNGTDAGNGGDGGFGRASNITGTETYYGGGGAGGVNTDNNNNERVRGFGGRGGGGDGSIDHTESGSNASANTGGGGGGKDWQGSTGGTGGSGIVVVRYTPRVRSSSTSTVVFDYSDKDGTTAARAAVSAHQLKASFPNTPDGIYHIMHNGTVHQFYVDFTTEGGPWILVCKMPASNATYGYDHSMWTNTSGGVTVGPTDLSTTDEYYLSSAFYTYSSLVTRLSMFEPTRWNAIVHPSSATVQSLANGTFNSVSGSQGATGEIPANLRARPGTYKPLGLTNAVIASGNKATSAGAWHRYGFMPNSADRWGHDIRIGWSADNDSSDSGDTVCGFGFKAYGSAPGATGYSGGAGCGWSYYSSWTSGSGSTSGNLKGWIWVRA